VDIRSGRVLVGKYSFLILSGNGSVELLYLEIRSGWPGLLGCQLVAWYRVMKWNPPRFGVLVNAASCNM